MERFGRDVRFLAETESTNLDAARWALQGAPDGSVVLGDYQSGGKGRLDRTWEAPPGKCLLFSVILRQGIETAPLISLAAGGALAECLRGVVAAELKWPNDLMIGNRKAAGILSEGHSDFVVCGIGLNVNVQDFPDDLVGKATSLLIETGKEHDRLKLLGDFLKVFTQWCALSSDQIVNRYRPLCLTIGRHVEVQTPAGTVGGVATDVSMDGGLILDGGVPVLAGDVVHLLDSPD